MLSIRRPSKADKVVNMFQEVGDQFPLEEVLRVSGIKGYGSLKAMLSYIRSAPVNNIDIRITDGMCELMK